MILHKTKPPKVIFHIQFMILPSLEIIRSESSEIEGYQFKNSLSGQYGHLVRTATASTFRAVYPQGRFIFTFINTSKSNGIRQGGYTVERRTGGSEIWPESSACHSGHTSQLLCEIMQFMRLGVRKPKLKTGSCLYPIQMIISVQV